MNEQKDVFQSIMESEAEPVRNSYSSHSTNATAETIINVLATLLLFGGIIGGIALIIAGITDASRYGAGPVEFFGGFLVIFISVIQWAFTKIIINISRNLFNINEFLRERFSDKET